ncbi:MAG: 1-deoxy-D-xylulose-5-phosphate synthase, partial [Lachnospiraceae bacterium]|nr:1-deoxy-D-xylulose-5-phosphate synthase [Lachnospiraceae bacterium]
MLERVPSAEDIRGMSEKEIAVLAGEIRDFIIQKTAVKGGHLSSNLGTVELTLALFRSFDLPKDKVIWDVGHQSYAYKLLSGRMEGFDHLRDLHGMSGFPKVRESAYDCFDTGHSSTSLSAGIGFVKARDLLKQDYKVVSIIGDGSMTGGEAFEALNNAAVLKSNFIIVLNDNEMSISRNVGGLRKYLTEIRSAKGYNQAKENVKKTLSGIPRIGAGLVDKLSSFKDGLKEVLMPSGMVFENLGITYLGPVDGHDVMEMEKLFLRAKEMDRCVLIHVMTTKGKGYGPAESNPERYHGVNPFDPATGRPVSRKKGLTYSDVFGKFLVNAAKTAPDICAITAAMTCNVGLYSFRKHFPERFFDVGIAEQHAVTFAAGLAMAGLHPYVAVFSSFLQRAYDQIVHDVCMQDLPVVFGVDRAGIVGRDGETHQGAFDLAYLSSVPNMAVAAPKDGAELEAMLRFSLTYRHPLAIRYPRGLAM